jgi:hypothetical protein
MKCQGILASLGRGGMSTIAFWIDTVKFLKKSKKVGQKDPALFFRRKFYLATWAIACGVQSKPERLLRLIIILTEGR